jgi:predicted ArsR family transcriptional regulator
MKIIDVPLTNEVEGDDARVLAFLNERSDDVFKLSDAEEIGQALGLDAHAAEGALRRLVDQGLVSRARLQREVWHGSHAAVEQLCVFSSAAVRV